MLREHANGYTKKFVRFVLVESGVWDWAQLNAANDEAPVAESAAPETEETVAELDDWQAEFEQTLQDLNEEEFIDEPAPPSVAGPTPSSSGSSSGSNELTIENVQGVFDELVRPALQADGGDITLVKVEDNNIHVELIGACSTCPSATMTMKMGIEQMLHDEFPEMGELINVAGEPQPFL
jgi:Fe-S cluster biogenesis protein NfuA